MNDLRYAFRTLVKSPAFTFVALLTLALGIGANSAIFSVVNRVLLPPLPFKNPDRLVVVWENATDLGFPRNTPSPANFLDWRDQNTVFDGTMAFAERSYNLTGDGEPERLVIAVALLAGLLPARALRHASVPPGPCESKFSWKADNSN
ncbi:MAG: hypothetical protein ABR514_00560 [Chthoniobacterales bacterium]